MVEERRSRWRKREGERRPIGPEKKTRGHKDSEKEGREEGRFNAAMISSRSTKWRASHGPLDNGPSATCSRVLTRPILR